MSVKVSAVKIVDVQAFLNDQNGEPRSSWSKGPQHEIIGQFLEALDADPKGFRDVLTDLYNATIPQERGRAATLCESEELTRIADAVYQEAPVDAKYSWVLNENTYRYNTFVRSLNGATNLTMISPEFLRKRHADWMKGVINADGSRAGTNLHITPTIRASKPKTDGANGTTVTTGNVTESIA